MPRAAQYIFLGCIVVVAVVVLISIHRCSLPVCVGESGLILAYHGKDQSQERNGPLDSCNKSCLWEKRQSYRKGLALDMCRALHQDTESDQPLVTRYSLDQSRNKTTRALMLSHFLVIDSLKVIYCFIPKVSCTSWKRLLIVISDKTKSMEEMAKVIRLNARRKFHSLADYSVAEAQKLLATYRAFVFVRNPYERVLSAYQEKFQEDYSASRQTRRQYSKTIIRMTGGSPDNVRRLLRSQRRKDGTLNVTFAQFARFVSSLDDPRNRRFVNDHWMPMHQICHPCMVDFDWIGHFDSLRTDADFILRAVGADPIYRFPNFTTNPTGSSNEKTLLRYYSTLTTAEIEDLHKYYELDFSLFGFDIPPSIRGLLNERARANELHHTTVGP